LLLRPAGPEHLRPGVGAHLCRCRDPPHPVRHPEGLLRGHRRLRLPHGRRGRRAASGARPAARAHPGRPPAGERLLRYLAAPGPHHRPRPRTAPRRRGSALALRPGGALLERPAVSPRRLLRLLRLLLLPVSLLLLGSCASRPPVKAWQREHLARPSMTPDSE